MSDAEVKDVEVPEAETVETIVPKDVVKEVADDVEEDEALEKDEEDSEAKDSEDSVDAPEVEHKNGVEPKANGDTNGDAAGDHDDGGEKRKNGAEILDGVVEGISPEKKIKLVDDKSDGVEGDVEAAANGGSEEVAAS